MSVVEFPHVDVTRPPCLSSRQKDVLRALRRGLSNKEIARELGLTEATVKVHVKAILRIIKASNRTVAALNAGQWLRE